MEVHLIHFDSIDSTNTWAKNHAKDLDPKKMTCITADVQTAGHGRFNRKWISMEGNLLMSLFFTIPLRDPTLPLLSEICAFSCVQVLREKGIFVEIKWPNDLIIQKKKLSGVLVETAPLETCLGIIVGVGMNVNVPVETTQPTISLFELTGHRWNLEELRDAIILQFQKDLTMDFSKRWKEFEALMAYKNEPISCKIGTKMVHGILLGINSQGYLRMRLPDRSILEVMSGDIEHLREDPQTSLL